MITLTTYIPDIGVRITSETLSDTQMKCNVGLTIFKSHVRVIPHFENEVLRADRIVDRDRNDRSVTNLTHVFL